MTAAPPNKLEQTLAMRDRTPDVFAHLFVMPMYNGERFARLHEVTYVYGISSRSLDAMLIQLSV